MAWTFCGSNGEPIYLHCPCNLAELEIPTVSFPVVENSPCSAVTFFLDFLSLDHVCAVQESTKDLSGVYMQVFRDFLPYFKMFWLTKTLFSGTSSQQDYNFLLIFQSSMSRARKGPQHKSNINMVLTQCISLVPVAEFLLVSDCFGVIFSAFKQLSFLSCLELVIFTCGKVSPIQAAQLLPRPASLYICFISFQLSLHLQLEHMVPDEMLGANLKSCPPCVALAHQNWEEVS